ncbi:MAG: helix-turn-helix domain-containing protein [Candidatus Nanopelagicales bacterium]
MDKYLTTREVGELARAPETTVRYWRHIDYGPPSFKVGRRVLYRERDVIAWLERLQSEAAIPVAALTRPQS